MWVYVVLAILGAGFAVAIVGAVLWVLTRPADRIQLETACLFLTCLSFFASAWQMFARGGLLASFAVVLGTLSVFLYFSMAALALYYKRWAWQVAIGAFVVQLALASWVALQASLSGSWSAVVVAMVWLLVGALGLWACMHRGSRELVVSAAANAA